MGTANEYKKFKSEDDLSATLRPKDVAEYLGINEPKAYELFNRQDFGSIKIGQRWIVTKKAFLRWLDKEGQKQKFLKDYYDLSEKEKSLVEETFWKAVKFLDEQKKIDLERQDVIKLMSD